MTLRNGSGSTLDKSGLLAAATQLPAPEARFRLNSDVYETYPLSGEANFESGQRRKFKAGTVLTQSQIDALYPAATVGTVSPATGPAVGGTTITITGTNLGGCKGVTVGGNPCTEVKVWSQTKVTAKTAAHATGAVSVVVRDDSGDVTKANGFTYV